MPEFADIDVWKKRSEIDYISLFISSWLCLNVWMQNNSELTDINDRLLLIELKAKDSILKDQFSELINGADSKAIAFKGHFVELNSALDNARLVYLKLPNNLHGTLNRFISFSNCIIDWNDGAPELETILKGEGQRNKITIAPNFWVTDDSNNLFIAYIEILYQVRCLLFHGSLPLTEVSERLIMNFYLTLSMIMKPLGR